jgi:hypothetical protein
MEVVIVSRHPAAIQFIIEEAGLPADTPVITGNATEEDVSDKHVYGNIPFYLANCAARVTVIEFTGAPPRGAEYTKEDMYLAGAGLATYKVLCDC